MEGLSVPKGFSKPEPPPQLPFATLEVLACDYNRAIVEKLLHLRVDTCYPGQVPNGSKRPVGKLARAGSSTSTTSSTSNSHHHVQGSQVSTLLHRSPTRPASPILYSRGCSNNATVPQDTTKKGSSCKSRRLEVATHLAKAFAPQFLEFRDL